MTGTGPDGPLVVVALGGNALLPRGERLEASSQHAAARRAARLLAPLAQTTRLVVTHGNGPQVGLLALMNDAYGAVSPYPLDVLGAETEGELGYIIEMELDNAIPGQDTVAVVTRTEVDAGDPAFGDPTKFIGPVYEEAQARKLADELGWTVKRDGDAWRRVVASPEPQRIVQLGAIRRLVDGGFLVVCAGGGGVPVVRGADGADAGVEAVIDKDLASALLATQLGADVLVLATDVDGVYADFGTAAQCRVDAATPAQLRAGSFAAGSMGPKVEAICRFVEQGGGRGAIGALEAVGDLVAGDGGTQVRGRPTPRAAPSR
ncbi:MAG TPA: carbamate kinase [Solirubrobacteraceae bacterium]|nr:carbamate kinase [Solirubrobacteraceae bacterium]